MMTFLGFMLVLTTGWMQLYGAVRETYNGISEYKATISKLEKRNRQDRLGMILEREQFLEFRQNVAALMPEALRLNGVGAEGFALRGLASTITKSESDQVRVVIAKTLFESGKRYFREKNYAKAEKAFRQIINKFSYSIHVADSYFLLAESHYLENEPEECTTVIQQMIELFPSHELTGFAMVRLGHIYEAQNRSEEAVEIYKTVMRSFPQRDVASQAKSSLRGIEL